MESPYEINPAGFTIHGCIHAAREDAHCIMHVHSLNGVAVSAQREGVLPISQQSLFVLASLAYHDYEGVALNPDEQPRLVADLGKKSLPDAAQPRPADRGLLTGRGVSAHVPVRGDLRDPAARAERRQGAAQRSTMRSFGGIRAAAPRSRAARAALLSGRACCGVWIDVNPGYRD